MMKKLIRTGFWVSIGAGLGIWFAPSNGREFLREKFALAQVGATKFHKSVSSKLYSNLGLKQVQPQKALGLKWNEKCLC